MFSFVVEPPVDIHLTMFKKMIADSWEHCTSQIESLEINEKATPGYAAAIGSAQYRDQ
jgi:hypothetical protein